MRTIEEVKERLKRYEKYELLYLPDKGYIAWKIGTGENYEIILVESYGNHSGHGKEVFNQFLDKLQSNPPYESIYVFFRWNNKIAKNYYKKIGFKIKRLRGIYKDKLAGIGYNSYKNLYEANR